MQENVLDSRQALASEIAEAVRGQLKAKQTAESLSAAIEKNLIEEARRAELKLAYLRVAAAGAFAVFVLGRLVLSRFTAIAPPTIGSLAASLVWMTFAAAVLGILRRDWYKAWLRRAFPIADATLLVAGLGLSRMGVDPFSPPAGLATTFAGLCVLLAFTGAFRLTRSAVELTTGLAILSLLVTAALGWVPVMAAGGSLVAVLLSGALALGVTDMVRRVVMNEVTRVNLDRMYDDAQTNHRCSRGDPADRCARPPQSAQHDPHGDVAAHRGAGTRNGASQSAAHHPAVRRPNESSHPGPAQRDDDRSGAPVDCRAKDDRVRPVSRSVGDARADRPREIALSRRQRRRRSSGGTGRSRPGAAGDLQSRRQRREIHAGRGHDHALRRAIQWTGAVLGDRHRTGNPASARSRGSSENSGRPSAAMAAASDWASRSRAASWRRTAGRSTSRARLGREAFSRSAFPSGREKRRARRTRRPSARRLRGKWRRPRPVGTVRPVTRYPLPVSRLPVPVPAIRYPLVPIPDPDTGTRYRYPTTGSGSAHRMAGTGATQTRPTTQAQFAKRLHRNDLPV